MFSFKSVKETVNNLTISTLSFYVEGALALLSTDEPRLTS